MKTWEEERREASELVLADTGWVEMGENSLTWSDWMVGHVQATATIEILECVWHERGWEMKVEAKAA